jgi:hypothetical protein
VASRRWLTSGQGYRDELANGYGDCDRRIVASPILVVIQLRQAARDRYVTISSNQFEIWQSPAFQEDQLFLLHKLPAASWEEFVAGGRTSVPSAPYIGWAGLLRPVPTKNSESVEKSSDLSCRAVVSPACSQTSRRSSPGSLVGFAAARNWSSRSLHSATKWRSLRRRRQSRPQLSCVVRLLRVWLFRVWPHCRDLIVPVKPATENRDRGAVL